MKILLLAKFLTLCELHSGPLKFIDDVYIYFFKIMVALRLIKNPIISGSTEQIKPAVLI